MSSFILNSKGQKHEKGGWRCSGHENGDFSERVRDFSLDFIRPSDFFGARRKVALRREAYAWAPVLKSFDKICEVGVLSYLFYPLFKCFVDDSVGLRP